MELITKKIQSPEIIREKIQTVAKKDGSMASFYANENGSIQSTVFIPFPGVSLVYKDVHIPEFISNWRYKPDRALIIEHCREGRLECPIDDENLYLAPNDIIVFRTDPNVRELHYPVSHYHGVAIVIHLDEPSPILQAHLSQTGFDPEQIIETWLPNGRYYSVLKESDALMQVFENIYHAPEPLKNTYYGLKILESLLLLASSVPKIDESSKRRVSKAQAALVERVHDYVMEHLEERFTIDELANEFNISPTQLKKYFSVIYGMSMQSFIREQKMKAAARLLETTEMKVCEVAKKMGYSNFSKFSAAFQSVMGQSPRQYRMEHYFPVDTE